MRPQPIFVPVAQAIADRAWLAAFYRRKYGSRRTSFVATRDDDSEWDQNVRGALGELGYGVFTDCLDEWKMYGLTKAARDSGDIGNHEVRSIREAGHHLSVYPHDPDGRPVILARPVFGGIYLHGWIYAGEAKRREYWQPQRRREAWWLKSSALWEMASCPHPLEPLAELRKSEAAI